MIIYIYANMPLPTPIKTQSLSNSNVYTDHLGVWVKCRFWFTWAGMVRSENMHFLQVPKSCWFCQSWTTLWLKRKHNSLYISFLNCELLDTRACDLLIFESLESNTHVNMQNILNEFTLCCYLVLIFLNVEQSYQKLASVLTSTQLQNFIQSKPWLFHF